MNFHSRKTEAPEINLIPFIDVLLVVLIFMVLSTTYARYTELQIQLPSAMGTPQMTKPKEILVNVSNNGIYMIAGQRIMERDTDSVQVALETAMQGQRDAVLIINADAAATHQSVVTIMDVARKAGMDRITFAAQSTKYAKRPKP